MIDGLIAQLQRNTLSRDHALAALGVFVGFLITMGSTLVAVGSGFTLAMADASGVQFFTKMWLSSVYYLGGIVLLVFGARIFGKAFFKPRKQDRNLLPAVKILVDEMLDGTDERLRKEGYEVYSVKKLRDKGERLQSDYSILKYAEANSMVLVTEDEENCEACMENGIRVIRHGQNKTFENLILELKRL